jgi:asparagine synthase (glutamine-hydrolysing)
LRAASTVQALRAGGGCDTAPDPAGHAGFFLLGSIPEPHTLYKSIRALPAGHTLAATEAGVENPKRYFSIAEILRTLRPGEGAAPLAEALRESVARHMVADVPVGVFLSAGIDSTVLCALAAECHGAGLEAVTLGVRAFQGTAQDEVPFAAEVARATGARHRVVWVGAEDFRAAREAALAAMDQPSVDGVNVYFVARAARAAGLKVALSGLGGDELFGGYDTFVKAPQLAAAVGALPISPALGRALRVAAAPLLKPFVHPKWAGVLEWGGDVAGAWYLRRGLYMPWELPEVIDAEMAREGLQALDLAQRLAADGDGLSPWRQVQALEMGWYMRNQLLRDADWAGMAHGLEIRVPLVDATLFARLAPWLGPKGPTKADLARMADQLPPALAARPKTGFSLPIREWLAGPQVSLRDWARLVYRASVSRK